MGKKRKKGKRQGFSLLRTITFFIICMHIMVVCALLLMNAYMKLERLTDQYLTCSDQTDTFVEASDYLTDSSQLYAITGDRQYMDKYVKEVTETKRREAAVAALKESVEQYEIDPAIEELPKKAEAALEYSNELAERELYAMHLESLSINLAESDIPDLVRNAAITDEDAALTSEQKHDRAQEMLFDGTYVALKGDINNETRMSASSILEIIDSARAESRANVRRNINIYVWMVMLIAVGNVIMLLTINMKIMRPLRKFKVSLDADKEFEVTGSKEIREFALAYNSLYLHNRRRTSELKKNNEIDALTGLFNRRAFDVLRDKFAASESKLIFIALDLDRFKKINDTCGHPIGDEALRCVASELKSKFHSSDFLFRLGGDEFAVLITNTSNTSQERVVEVIRDMNTDLKSVAVFDNRLSVSAGVAISYSGFNESLYAHADTALYESKRRGGAQCTIYKG